MPASHVPVIVRVPNAVPVPIPVHTCANYLCHSLARELLGHMNVNFFVINGGSHSSSCECDIRQKCDRGH